MIKKIIISITIVFCLITTYADEILKVLQNGLNGYNGCVDSYLYRKGDDPSSVDQNYNDSPYLMTAC